MAIMRAHVDLAGKILGDTIEGGDITGIALRHHEKQTPGQAALVRPERSVQSQIRSQAEGLSPGRFKWKAPPHIFLQNINPFL